MIINRLNLECSEILKSEFKIKPYKSNYKIYSNEEWNKFLVQTNSNKESLGVYFPRSFSVHLKRNSEFLPVNFLHEFFGHGLFCEYSLIGKKIVTLDSKLEETKKQILGVKKLPKNKHFKVGKTNPYFNIYKQQINELRKFCNDNNHNYEGFAMWLENYLASFTNNKYLFEKKMEKIVHSEYRELFNQFKLFEDKYGKFALIYQLGFPKFYDKDIIIDILKKRYGKEFETIELCILYGSRKPYSDIDLFIVSEKINSYYDIWFDVYAKTKKEFNYELKMLDISVTDPIFSGEFIIGSDKSDSLRKKVLDMPITKEAINHNLKKSEEQGKFVLMLPKKSKEWKIASSYENSLRTNAEELKKGEKMLTLR